MNRVHFRNGVWQIVRDWRVVDAAIAFPTLHDKDPVWVTANLDPSLPAAVRASLLASPASGSAPPDGTLPTSHEPSRLKGQQFGGQKRPQGLPPPDVRSPSAQ